MRTTCLVAAAAVVVLILGGCSSQLSGAADPQPKPDASADSGQVVDPCGLVADATTRTFDLSTPIATDDPVVEGSRQCIWRSGKAKGNYHLASLPSRYTLKSVDAGYDDPRPATVAGRNSLETYFSEARRDRECILFVEIAPTALLAFQFEPADRSLTTTHESICGVVREFADSVVAAM